MLKKSLVISILLSSLVLSGCNKSNTSSFNDSSKQESDDSTEIDTSSDISSSDTSTSEEELGSISFNNLKETYYPYSDPIKQYLTNDDVVEWYQSETVGYKAITIEFSSTLKNVKQYRFYYGTKEDFSDSKVINISSKANHIDLYNLLKDQTYFIKLSSIINNEECNEITASFKTTDLGPRPMRVGGIDNVRDLGGYKTGETKTLQNKIFRGSEMNGSHGLNLSDEGQAVMSDELGIKLDIDLRSDSEAENITKSPINSASYKRYTVSNYDNIFSNESTKKLYKEIFADLANENNYPVYFHCWGGADRTGTLAFIINALLGVEEKELIQDYEYTTFSSFGVRSRAPGAAGQRFNEFLQAFHRLAGNTPKEKAITYLKSIGVTDAQLKNIDAIMHGTEVEIDVNCPSEYCSTFSKELTLTTNGGEVKEVFINDVSKSFTYNDGKITISSSLLNDLPEGIINGKIVFTNNRAVSFTFNNKKVEYVDVGELTSIEGYLSIQTRTTLDTPVGYNKYVRARLLTNTPQNGGVYMLIGSYGFLLRGGLFRFINMTTSGTIQDFRVGPDCSYDLFNTPKDVFLKINVTDSSVGFDIYVMNDERVSHYEYELPSAKLQTNEIPNEQAKVTFDRNSTDVNYLYVFPYTPTVTNEVEYVEGEDENISIYFSNPEDITKVTIENKEVTYRVDNYKVIINSDQIANPDNKDVLNGKIYTQDNEYAFAIKYKKPAPKYVDGVISLNSETKQYVGSTSLGYGNKIKLHLKTTTVNNGNLYILIGSYGVRLRGGSFRTAYRTTGEALELSPRPDGTLYGANTNFFDLGGYIEISVSIKDESTITIDWSIYNEQNILQNTYSIDRTRLSTGEISNDNASVSIDIGDASETQACVFYQA